MTDDVLVDGHPGPGDWLSDRACQFGDGLFETIAVRDGMPCQWQAHMARLAQGCERLRLPLPDFGALARDARSLASGRTRAVLKVYWTAGASARGYRRPHALKPRRVVRCGDWPYQAPQRPWTTRLCSHRLSENPGLAGIKHLNRLDQVLARAEWDDPAIDEGIMLGQDGRVVSGTMTNLVVQRDGRLLTPAVDGAGISGVVRGLLLGLAAHDGQAAVATRMSPDEVRRADALYLTNSLIGVVRVRRFDETLYDLDVAEHPLLGRTRGLCETPTAPVSVDG